MFIRYFLKVVCEYKMGKKGRTIDRIFIERIILDIFTINKGIFPSSSRLSERAGCW